METKAILFATLLTKMLLRLFLRLNLSSSLANRYDEQERVFFLEPGTSLGQSFFNLTMTSAGTVLCSYPAENDKIVRYNPGGPINELKVDYSDEGAGNIMAYITTDLPTVSKDVEEVVYLSKYYQYIYPRSIASIYAYTSLSILPYLYLSFTFFARVLYISNP